MRDQAEDRLTGLLTNAHEPFERSGAPMKALVFERKMAKFAAATVAGRFAPGSGAKYGPLKLKDLDAPELLGPDWVRFKPRLSGICGSDLATIDAQSSRYFEPIVSFPFVLGHEVVGDLPDGSRAVLIPVLHCAHPRHRSGVRGVCRRQHQPLRAHRVRSSRARVAVGLLPRHRRRLVGRDGGAPRPVVHDPGRSLRRAGSDDRADGVRGARGAQGPLRHRRRSSARARSAC